MIVHFVGICMFAINRNPPQAFLPNISNGLRDHPGSRPHEAIIAVPPDGVDFSQWGPPIIKRVPALHNDIFWVFPLNGVDISFVPAPSGNMSTIDVSVLRQMRDVVQANCPDKTELIDLDHPTSDLIAARVMIPGGPLRSINIVTPAPGPDNVLATTDLTVANRVTIVGTSLPDASGAGGGVMRVLRILDTPEIGICNVDPVAVSFDDIVDRELYCALMQVPLLAEKELAAAARPSPRPRAFPITLGPGCSNTQWP